MKQFVYFIRPIGRDGPIKIGVSCAPPERLGTLMCWSPYPLEVAVAIPGSYKLERRIQERFAASHSHKEWFLETPALLALIERLKSGIPIEEAINLNARDPGARFRPGKNWTAAERLRQSYVIRFGHLIRKKGLYYPERVGGILDRLHKSGVMPSADERRYLEGVLTDPEVHCATREEHLAKVRAQFPLIGGYA